MNDVFISYQRQRRPLVSYLAQTLEAYGLKVWWDYQIGGGTKVSPAVEEEIKNSRCTLVLWCSRSIESDWVKDEADVAKRIGNYLPVAIETVEPPMSFRSTHVTDLSGWNCSLEHEAFQRVLRDIEGKLQRTLSPTDRSIERQRTWVNLDRPIFPPLRGTPDSADTSAKITEKPSAGGGGEDSPSLISHWETRIRSLPLNMDHALRLTRDEIGRRMNDGKFGLLQLHPVVRDAVILAIQEANIARAYAERARVARRLATEAAATWKNNAGRFIMSNDRSAYSCVEKFEDTETGLGVLKHKTGKSKGDEHAGFFLNGTLRGPGVYIWADDGDPGNAWREEGDHAGPNEFGYGYKIWRNGFSYAGQLLGDERDGYGITTTSGGYLYEGEWKEDLSGIGVGWLPSGEIYKSGMWKDGELIAPMQNAQVGTPPALQAPPST